MKHVRLGWWCAMMALALLLTPVLNVAAAYAASPAVAEAQALYDTAKFPEAVVKLRDALGTGAVTGSDALAARALMARCLVKAGNRLEAKQVFKTVLRSDPAWRPDALSVPPDEMDVFNLALKEITAEQIEAGQRIPASLSFYLGKGSGDNKSLGEIQKYLGGSEKLDSQTELGGSVRFPLRPRLSLDLELSRLSSTGEDSTAAPNTIEFEAAAMPMVVSLYWTAVTGAKQRVNLFAGAGPLLSASNSIDLPFFNFRIKIADQKTGFYFHTGAEGEYLITPKIALSGRVLYRSATASKLYHDSTLEFYGERAIKDRKVDFSGFGAHVGIRAYIGY